MSCAFDTLFMPELLGASADVESHCPSTGDPTTLTVDGTDVSDVRPAEAVLSDLHKDEPLDQNVITFCHYIHFLREPRRGGGVNSETRRHIHDLARPGSEIAHCVSRGRCPSALGD